MSFLLLSVFGYAQITFERTYGGNKIDNGGSVLQTIDSGYIIAGYTESFGAGLKDAQLIRTNKYGDTIWTHTYGGVYNDYAASVLQTNDNGFIVIGGTYNYEQQFTFLIKTDANGDTLWTRVNHWGYYVYGCSIIKTNDNGFLYTGGQRDSIMSPIHTILVKTDENGDTLWTKEYSGPKNQSSGTSVIHTFDNGYFITGRASFNNADIFLIKTDDNGDALWTKVYGGNELQEGYSVIQANDSGYIICGRTEIWGGYNVLLMKIDKNGDSIWSRTYSNNNESSEGRSVVKTNDDNYIIVGTSGGYLSLNLDIFLIKTDVNGNTIWTRTHGDDYADVGQFGAATFDGGLIITGTHGGTVLDSMDVYLIKTDANGQVAGIDHYSSSMNNRITVYPNPSTGKVNIQIPPQFGQTKTLELFDCVGQKQFEKTNDFTDIDISSLTSGLYFIVVTNTDNERQTLKIIKN